MKLNERSQKIFKKILNNPDINSKQLKKAFHLTRRQLSYSLTKINEWLREHQLPEIERTRQGFFLVDQKVYSSVTGDVNNPPAPQPYLSKAEREDLLLLMLVSSDDLSLHHFTSELAVSQNTILSDLKTVKTFLAECDLTIRYSRKFGYYLHGNEFNIRRLIFHLTCKWLTMGDGASRIQRVAGITKEEVGELKRRIHTLEQKLNLTFTDENIQSMPYTLLLILKRIKLGRLINRFSIHYEELSDTKQYHATEELLSGFEEIPREERLFITLYLLTTNVYWSKTSTEGQVPNLLPALVDMLRLFEKRACIALQEKEQLLTKLLLHVNPAYYRIKYQLTEMSKTSTKISEEYKELHHLVKQSMKPLETLIGVEIPENESSYLTLLIGGWLTRQGDSIQKKTKAIVVCSKGVSISRFLLSELKELFPDFIFLDSLSLREFAIYPLNYDLVFSTIPLDTTKKLFLTSSILEREEKKRLKEQVMFYLRGYSPPDIKVDDILEIVNNYAVITNEQELANDLYRYIYRDQKAPTKSGPINTLATLPDLITVRHITMRDAVASWEEALHIASQPLIDEQKISPTYVEAMVDNERDPYIIISPHWAIPHAAPDKGVYDVGMSLLHLQKGVSFTADEKVHLMVVIAAVDKQKHLKALMQLMKLAGSKEARKAIEQSTSEDEIFKIIKQYTKDD
ncbi:BH0193 [Halalkalibacterium halodurans C-125]|uniref:Ascorbate-specific PTS system EIIA component n=2 Tax=Halalkalibacterium halodurans TaxID=86665 RepID=Q9KGB4_HALH5|nr:BglG family transcription antiterminator [Halalkalibacterium halodurans]BAB03912.1 BH0193 [Halalkalibacterium halodurans C-125]